MANFTKINADTLSANEVLRRYVSGARTIAAANRGGTFLGNRDIAPDSLREFGIILPKGGMILPHHTPEEIRAALEELRRAEQAVARERAAEEAARRNVERAARDARRARFIAFAEQYFSTQGSSLRLQQSTALAWSVWLHDSAQPHAHYVGVRESDLPPEGGEEEALRALAERYGDERRGDERQRAEEEELLRTIPAGILRKVRPKNVSEVVYRLGYEMVAVTREGERFGLSYFTLPGKQNHLRQLLPYDETLSHARACIQAGATYSPAKRWEEIRAALTSGERCQEHWFLYSEEYENDQGKKKSSSRKAEILFLGPVRLDTNTDPLLGDSEKEFALRIQAELGGENLPPKEVPEPRRPWYQGSGTDFDAVT